nr:MAG TPA: hypothetical protein [Bacteriophage sp.]
MQVIIYYIALKMFGYIATYEKSKRGCSNATL